MKTFLCVLHLMLLDEQSGWSGYKLGMIVEKAKLYLLERETSNSWWWKKSNNLNALGREHLSSRMYRG